MNPESIALIKRACKSAGISEFSEVHLFSGDHEGVGEVEIRVRDAGEEAGSLRWSVLVTADDGRFATGNPEAELDTALAMVHWSDLSRSR